MAVSAAEGSSVSKGDIWDPHTHTRAQRRRKIQVLLARFTFIGAMLAVWESLSGRVIDEFWISKPSAVLERTGEWLRDGTIADNLFYTLQSTVYGYVCGSILGIALGFLLGRVRFLAEVLDPLILAVYSIPKIALAPLFILWFGIGMISKVVIAAVTVFFLVFYNTYRGVREVDRDLIDVVRIMGGSQRQVLFGVVLPSSTVWIFTGLRIAIPYALTGAVVGEIVASNKGVGHMLKVSANTFDTTGMFVMLGVLVVTSSIIFVALNRIEKRRSRWSTTQFQE